MGLWSGYFFGEADVALIAEIAKIHKVSKDVVEKHYRKMLEAVKHEVQA